MITGNLFVPNKDISNLLKTESLMGKIKLHM